MMIIITTNMKIIMMEITIKNIKIDLCLLLKYIDLIFLNNNVFVI